MIQILNYEQNEDEKLNKLNRSLIYHDEKLITDLLTKALSEDFETCVWGTGAVGTGFGKQILEEYGIKIDYYCDNRHELLDTEITCGIYCRSIDKLVNNTEKTICFILVGYAGIGSIYRQLVKAGVKNIVTYDDLFALPTIMKKNLPFMNKKNIAIYTCITGDYDDLREPKYISNKCDYYLISDRKPEKDSIYQWMDIKNYLPKDITDPIYQNRYCKINAHKIFPEYRYSIYVDGNITITGKIDETVSKLKRARIGVIAENYTSNIFEYALRGIKEKVDLPEQIMRQMEVYWLRGLPENAGSFFCGILVREHNNPICVKLMEEWWEEFCTYAKRDQMPFVYVLWKNGFSKEDILLLCDIDQYDPWDRTPYWEYTKKHKKERFRISEG